MALSSVKKAFTAKPAYAGDPNCDFLAEACRKATAKNAYQPDDNLKALIVSKINENTPGAQVPIKVTYDIIRRRLQMENPHKQWLAVDMTRHLLSACHERLRPYRTELLYHVARVAIKPNKKGPITAQHKARKAATDYLHQCGEEGQNALRMARMQLGNFQQSGGMPIGPLGPYGPDGHPMNPTGAYSTVPQPSSQLDGNSSGVKRGTPRIANVQQPTGDVIQDVRNLIDTANSHCNVLNDLVLAASTDPGEDRRERDRPLLAELKNEMLQVKDMFPGLLEKLSTLKTPESEQLMVQALEAHEQIEVCLDMERQYTEGTLPGGVSDGDDDEEEEEEEEGEDAAAADDPGADAAVAEAAADVEKAAHVEGATANEAVPAAAPPGGDVMGDLLSFGDSGPLPNAGEPVASAPVHARQVSEDMFGLNGLRADLPAGTAHAASHAAPETAASATGHDDPFLGGVSQESATTQQPAQPTGANPFAEAQQAPTPANGAFVSQGSGPAPPAQNPFGSSAFPLAPSPTGAAPGGPAPGAAGASTTPQPFPPQQPPPGQQPFMQFGAGPSGQGPPPGQGLPPGQGPPPGQYGAPPPYMGGHTGGMPPHGYGPPPGYQMYGQPAPGWGQPPTGQGPGQAPNPFGGSAFPPPSGLQQYGPPPGQYGGQGQQYGGPQGFPGGMPPQANPFGGPGGTAPMQQNLGPPHFGASATGMAAPGYSAPPANPFMASATGYGQPSWNPNAQKDAFQDLIIEHNKRSNPTPPMAQPMRQAGGAANGAM